MFTQSLIRRGIPEDRLALIERGGAFARRLRKRYPRARVLQMDAARLSEVELFDGERAGAVVSGLPLLLMPPRQVIALLEGAFEWLRPDAAFYQFTYGLEPPVPQRTLDRLGLEVARAGGTFANVPPAAVYRFRGRSRENSAPRRVCAASTS